MCKNIHVYVKNLQRHKFFHIRIDFFSNVAYNKVKESVDFSNYFAGTVYRHNIKGTETNIFRYPVCG